MIEAAALGVGLGIVTGLPLGVINVAIVQAATAGRRTFALGVGLGGALADSAHAALAFLGLAQLVTRRPDLTRVLAILAALVLVAFAILTWRRREPGRVRGPRDGGLVVGFGAGIALTLPNPAALAAWVTVAASLWPAATTAEAITLALGVGVGSAAWFTLLGRLVRRVPADHAALRFIPRVAVLAFLGFAIVAIVRAM